MDIGLIIGFLPWMLFYVLPTQTQGQLDIVLTIVLILTFIINGRDLCKGFILTWGTAGFFVFSFITVVILKITWVMSHMGILVSLVLATVAWFSLLIGKPFTMQYAKEHVPAEKWQNPSFIFVNRVLTLTWGLIFLLALSINTLQLYYPVMQHWTCAATSYGADIFGVWFTIWFPKWYRSYKKIKRNEK